MKKNFLLDEDDDHPIRIFKILTANAVDDSFDFDQSEENVRESMNVLLKNLQSLDAKLEQWERQT